MCVHVNNNNQQQKQNSVQRTRSQNFHSVRDAVFIVVAQDINAADTIGRETCVAQKTRKRQQIVVVCFVVGRRCHGTNATLANLESSEIRSVFFFI